MESDSNPPVENEVLLDLNFIPKWAQASIGENPYAHFVETGRERYPTESRPSRGGPRMDRGGREGKVPSRNARRDGRPPARETARSSEGPSERRFDSAQTSDRMSHESLMQAPPVEVRFLPERRYLSAVVKRIQRSRRAFPLSRLAGLLLSNPDFHLVKLEIAGDADPRWHLAQCDVCKMPFLDTAAALDHFSAVHRQDYFTALEREAPPPSGQFTCVVRSRLGGELLGPPNHHSYNDRILDLHATRFSHISMDEFRRTLETVHDLEAVEAWKKECQIQRVIVRRDDPEGAPVPAAEVKTWLAQQAVVHVHTVKRMVIPAAVARAAQDRAIQRLVRDAWSKESRFPMTLMIALRPALRHMGLHVFKAAGNMTFITAVSPSPMDSTHAIEPIRKALLYVDTHPGCTREEMLKDLFPQPEESDADRREVVTHLQWLADKGHVIEFFTGALAVPSHLPATLRHAESARSVPPAPR